MNRIETFDDLYFLFKKFLDVNIELLDINQFDMKVPLELRILYGLREYYKNKKDEILFRQQDELIPYEKLNFENPKFDFIWENQGCWTLQTEFSNTLPKVYKNENEEIGYLKNFIITYFLQELTFSLDYVVFDSMLSFEKIKSTFGNIEPLWINGKYEYLDNNYNYYLVENQGVAFDIPEVETTFFGTNSEDIYNRITNKKV